MAKVYLIGGPPRVGKTNLALEFIKQRPILATSTDAIRYTLRRVIDKNTSPALFNVGKFTSNNPEQRQYLKDNLEEVINKQNDESAIVWKSTVDFIHSNLEDGFDVLIEGIAVLPNLVKQLDCEYSAIFLGNQSPDHFETILQAAHQNQNDWLHNLEDETIEAFCLFGQAFSRHLESEANAHQLKYIEVSDKDFADSMKAALDFLLT